MLKEGVEEINYQLGQEVAGKGYYDDGVKRRWRLLRKLILNLEQILISKT